MFAAAIKLRYNMKGYDRPYRIGKKGNLLMWIISGLGFCGSLLAFVLSFIPPAQIATALKGVDPNASTEEMIRYALRAMVMKG